MLLSDTAVPVWHEARRELPFVFAGSAAASAGAAAVLVTAPRDAGAARRLAGIGAVTELVASLTMERRLGPLGTPYRERAAGTCMRAAKGLTAVGAALDDAPPARGTGRGPASARACSLAGGACLRFAVLAAGTQSAADPSSTVEPQRRRVADRAARPAG